MNKCWRQKTMSLEFQGHFSFPVKGSLCISSFFITFCILSTLPFLSHSHLYPQNLSIHMRFYSTWQMILVIVTQKTVTREKKKSDDIHILLAPLLSPLHSILLLQGSAWFNTHPCPKTPVCSVMYYKTHAVVGNACPKENNKLTTGQDRKAKILCLTNWYSPTLHHLSSVSTISSCAKSILAILKSFNHFVQHLGILI